MAKKKKPKASRTWAPDQQIKPKVPDDLCDKFEIIVDPNAAPVDWDGFLDALNVLVEKRLALRVDSKVTGIE
jgi:hypothetical protein